MVTVQAWTTLVRMVGTGGWVEGTDAGSGRKKREESSEGDVEVRGVDI